MKNPKLLFFIVLSFLVTFCFCFPGTILGEQDPLLKIQAFPDQNSVKSGMMFLVHVQAVNSSSGASTDFWSNSCSYEKHWVTDNSGVLIQSWTCTENTLEEITLDPGESYEKNIILYIPNRSETGPVTFRLGFKRMSENGDIAEPLWSNQVTMNVIVPEGMEETATPSEATDTALQTPAQAPVMSSGTDDIPSTAVSDPAAPEGSQPLVFQDPGVPINVAPGEEFSIALTSNLSTGFRWKMTLPEDQQAVKFLSSAHVVSGEAMPGVPGQEVYKFKAMTAGETKADFVYKRPWEPKTAPTRKIFTILVEETQ